MTENVKSVWLVDDKNNSNLLLITLISVGTIGMGLVLRKSN